MDNTMGLLMGKPVSTFPSSKVAFDPSQFGRRKILGRIKAETSPEYLREREARRKFGKSQKQVEFFLNRRVLRN
jgi:hypothetical protein